jgi:hypothetical protein
MPASELQKKEALEMLKQSLLGEPNSTVYSSHVQTTSERVLDSDFPRHVVNEKHAFFAVVSS